MKKKALKDLSLKKNSISKLQEALIGAAANNPISVKNICNTGCDSPVHTCGIINCNLNQDERRS